MLCCSNQSFELHQICECRRGHPSTPARCRTHRTASHSQTISTRSPLSASSTKVGFFSSSTITALTVPDPNFHFLIVLGTFPAPSQDSDTDNVKPVATGTQPRLPAILRIERTAFSATFTEHLAGGVITYTRPIGHTDIVRPRPCMTCLATPSRLASHSTRGCMAGWRARRTFRTSRSR